MAAGTFRTWTAAIVAGRIAFFVKGVAACGVCLDLSWGGLNRRT